MIRAVLERFGFSGGLIVTTMVTCTISLALSLLGHVLWGNPIKPVHFFNAILVPIIITPLIVGSLFRLVQELQRKEQALYELATIDVLTQVANRRHFYELSEQLLKQAKRAGETVSLIMVDADHFKQINDRYGHQFGDDALTLIARACTASVRESDIVARLGGEEFAITLPRTDLAGAAIVADRILEEVRRCSSDPHITVSIGIASVDAVEIRDLDNLLHCADVALYQAKSAGRDNRQIYDLAA